MVPDIDEHVKDSLWVVEIWLPDARQWRVDKMTRLQKYADAYLVAMKTALEKKQKIRIRRFVAEGRTPRGQKVGQKNG